MNCLFKVILDWKNCSNAKVLGIGTYEIHKTCPNLMLKNGGIKQIKNIKMIFQDPLIKPQIVELKELPVTRNYNFNFWRTFKNYRRSSHG